MGSQTLGIDVIAREEACRSCGGQLWWIVAVCPSWNPDVGEFIPVDYPGAIEVATAILADTEPDLVEQLAPRPGWQQGRGFNPNWCGACGHQPDWHTFEGVIERTLYGERIYLANGRVEVARWRAVRDTPRMVWCV